MLTLHQAASRTTAGAPLLPDLFPALAAEGIRFRRGQVTMLAGAPNAGKSLWALFYAVKSEVPTLYISADTDAYTTAIRTAAMLTGHTIITVEEAFATGIGVDFYLDELASLKHLKFDFSSSPTLDEIDLSVRAFGEAHGQYPHAIIIDNLMNVVSLHDNEWQGLREIAKAAHHIARATGACLFMLHHTSEAEGQPDKPPARKAVQGKISQLPSMIITISMLSATGEMRIACVKNRFAKSYPGADHYVSLFADPSRMTIHASKYAGIVAKEWT